MKTFLTLMLGALFLGSAYTQENYQFQHYGVEHGLSQSSISAIYQDSRGFLWVGTNKGLNKFNGHSFEVFMPALDTNTVALAHQSVYDVIEDQNGMIWAATRNGVSKYNPMLGTFTNFKKTGNCEGCLAGQLTKKLIEVAPYIYVGSSAGLSRIHSQTGEVKGWWYTDGSDGIPSIYSIRDFELLDTGEFMMATDDGLAYFNPEKETFRTISAKDGLPDAGNGIESIFRDSSGTYWLAMSSSGVVQLLGDPLQPTFRQLPQQELDGIPSQTVYEILEYPTGTLLFGSHEGIVAYQPKTDTYRYIRSITGNNLSLSNNEIHNLYIDNENRLWVAGNFGLDVYDPYVNQFQILGYSADPTKGLPSNTITALHEDNTGAIWIGNTETGVTVVQQKDGKETFHHINAGDGPKNLVNPVVFEISEDNDGAIYIVTGNGINKIVWPDRTNFNYTISTIPIGSVEENKLPTPYVNSIHEDAQHNKWFATHGKGIIKQNPEGKMSQFRYELRDPQYISGDYVNHIAMDATGNLWVSNAGSGFSHLNVVKNDTAFRKFKAKTPFNRVRSYNITLDGDRLFANTASGSYYFPKKEQLLTQNEAEVILFNEKNGLSDNSVMQVIPVSDSSYWASTGNGLSLINVNTKKATSYKYIAGAKNVEFSRGSGLITKDGMVYFGSLQGVLRFKPKEFKKNTAVPKVHFSNFKIWNEPVPIGVTNNGVTKIKNHIDFLKEITLRPSDKVFSITLNAINFTLPMETRYAYRLDGFEEQWTYTKDPVITRSNLDPGSYQLLAKAANNDGVWSDPISLTIEVLPPWYRTWWAHVLFALLIAGSIYLLLKLRLQQERKVELARAQERDIFRKRSSRDFHDEAGTKITRIALITELARIENSENKELQEHLNQIDENVQDLNSGMRDFIWTLDPTKDNAYDTLNRYIEFAGKFCEYANIQFKSEPISEELKTKELNMAERRHLLMILKEATNNCVKHGHPTLIDFNVTHKPGKLTLKLKDNGTGFKTEAANSGNGLRNMRERAEALGGALKIDSKTNGGTTLVLTLETTRLGN